MGSMTFLAWCEPNFFRDKFNIQSQAFGWPWDKFMVHGVNRPEDGSLNCVTMAITKWDKMDSQCHQLCTIEGHTQVSPTSSLNMNAKHMAL